VDDRRFSLCRPGSAGAFADLRERRIGRLRIADATVIALCTLFAILPLYGSFLAFAPDRQPIPVLFPKWVAVAVAIVALLSCVAIVPAGLRAAKSPTLVFAFVAGGIATMIVALTGFDPVQGFCLGAIVTGFGIAGLALCAADARTAQLCTRTFLWSALIASAFALAMTLTRYPVAVFAYNTGRAIGSFLNPNELAAYTLVALGCAVPLAILSRGRDRLAVATACLAGAALIATLSRWGALSAVCGVAAYAACTGSQRLLRASLVLAALGIAISLTTGALYHNPRDTVARTLAWRAGWTTFERFPLFGVGPLAYYRTYDSFRPPNAPGPGTPIANDPHSLPLAFAASGGLLSVLTLIASALILQRRAYAGAAGAGTLARGVILGLASGMVALYVDSLLNTVSIIFPLSYQSIALAIAIGRTGGGLEPP
jgi:hypothetical protein